MNAPIRWGILSTGTIAGTFVEDLRLLPDAEVAAVGSRTTEAAEAFAIRYGIPRAYGSWQALAEDPGVDVVYVATPHSHHHAATMTCLAAGKAALVEKAFTLHVPDAQELVATARSRGLFLMEAMWMRFLPGIRRLHELVAGGAIGDVVAVHADFSVVGPFPPTHRMRDRQLGGGALYDLGVYPISFAHLFLGEPAEVRAWARLDPQGADENTAALLGYASGALAAVTCTLLGDGTRRATITGTEGRIDLARHFHRPTELTLIRNDDSMELIAVPYTGLGYHYEAAEVQRCLRAGLPESPLMPHEETLAVMRTLDAVRERIGLTYPNSGRTSA
jgi:predicted dehydrogenase